MSVLRNTLAAYNAPNPDLYYSCTLKIARKVWPQLRTHKLNHLADHLGIKFNHHDAAQDAMAAAKVSIKACEVFEADTLKTLMNSVGVRIMRL